MSKPWLIINSGKTPIKKGVIGKMGNEKPHISFWIDKEEDIRVAIWDDGKENAFFQVTKRNRNLETPELLNSKNNQLDGIDITSNSEVEDEDLPF